MMQNKTIKIDVISDIACPWCYIGKHRLEKAIKLWDGVPVEVHWHPFQLNANIPKEGQNRRTYLLQKFGDAIRTDAMTRIHNAAKHEGITLDFGEKWLAVDTLPLHQLMHVAGNEGFKGELKERLFYAYFTENLHLNKPNVLYKIMEEYGWDKSKTATILGDKSILQQVKRDIKAYQEKGVTGVPFFVINDTYGISGAQPPEAFLDVFAQVLKNQTTRIEGGEESCEADGDCPI